MCGYGTYPCYTRDEGPSQLACLVQSRVKEGAASHGAKAKSQ